MLYRVRKEWNLASSQIGAYNILSNAINACPQGYNVYDEQGNLIYFYPTKLGSKCPYAVPTNVLRYNSHGDDVKWLQWQLVNLGFYCGKAGIDGWYGQGTYKGVESYQIANNLEVDGICGPQTRKSLIANGIPSDNPVPAPQPTKFVPRFKIPEKGNPYYNLIKDGGYATCIQGCPTQIGLTALSNCFSGETKIITRNGVIALKDLVDKEIYVLSKDGIYRKAIGHCYGEQDLYEITFKNGYSCQCTLNHRWVVRKGRNNQKYELIFKETKDLTNNSYIPYNFIFDEDYDEDGIRHGFIYGDGSYYNSKTQSLANLCGKKKEYMKDYFKNSKHINQQTNGTICCYPYPKEYKEIPSLDKSLNYLRGFIKGVIASDGCVDRYGNTKIGTVKEEDAKRISEICSILGYKNKISSETRDTNYKKNSTLYTICIKKACLPLSIFINPDQISRIGEIRNIKFTRVEKIIPLNKKELVYCVEEPETHTITLECGILTGQCVGYAGSRFNEIGKYGKWKYLNYPPNAEDFIDAAKAQGLKISQTPSLGAVIVWAKGKTHNNADGAGHVAIVEQINSDGTIITSESGYNSSPFWTTKRSNANGNWGNGSAYKFLGFIVNPAVK